MVFSDDEAPPKRVKSYGRRRGRTAAPCRPLEVLAPATVEFDATAGASKDAKQFVRGASDESGTPRDVASLFDRKVASDAKGSGGTQVVVGGAGGSAGGSAGGGAEGGAGGIVGGGEAAAALAAAARTDDDRGTEAATLPPPPASASASASASATTGRKRKPSFGRDSGVGAGWASNGVTGAGWGGWQSSAKGGGAGVGGGAGGGHASNGGGGASKKQRQLGTSALPSSSPPRPFSRARRAP